MAGLLSDVLPFLYSQGDRAKRHVHNLLSDPIGSLEQTAGGVQDAHRAQLGLLAQAFPDEKQPFKVGDQAALAQATQNMMNGPLGFAPAGMVKAASGAVGEAARLGRMREQGYEDGWYRGGREIADGPFYTPDREAAEGFAKRWGDKGSVREYAINPGRPFDLGKTYSPSDLMKLRDVLKDQYGSKYADDLLSIPTDFRGGRAPGAHIYQAVEQLTGGNARDALKAAGFDTLNAGQELVVLNAAGTVRDKALAGFDPKRRLSADPLASVGLGGVGLGLLGYSADDK